MSDQNIEKNVQTQKVERLDKKAQQPKSRRFSFCLDEPQPVTIILIEEGKIITKVGTVSHLDPSKETKSWLKIKPEDLFIDGVIMGHDNVIRVIDVNGKDVFDQVKRSFGPGM